MVSIAEAAPVSSKAALWAGRVISGLVVAFLILDGVMKVVKAAPVLQASVEMGWPASTARPLGIVLLVCVVFYVIPRTSVLGAILLTGFLGGATAAKVRLEDPWFFFSVVFGVLVWGGLYLRDERVRALVPLRKSDI